VSGALPGQCFSFKTTIKKTNLLMVTGIGEKEKKKEKIIKRHRVMTKKKKIGNEN